MLFTNQKHKILQIATRIKFFQYRVKNVIITKMETGLFTKQSNNLQPQKSQVDFRQNQSVKQKLSSI